MPARHVRRWLVAALAALLPLIVWILLQPVQVARGKFPAATPAAGLTAEQQTAVDLALADPRVRAHIVGRNAEVFGVQSVGPHLPAGYDACRVRDCRQVEIFVYDENATVVALVDLDGAEVRAVFLQRGIRPGANKRVRNLAAEIARNSPELIAELGYRPARDELSPMDGDIYSSACPASHLCLVMAIQQDSSAVWAEVDVVAEELVGLVRAAVPQADAPSQAEGRVSTGACPAPGNVTRDGWTVSYETTVSDGLRIFDVAYMGMPVLTSAKLAEWHVDYGLSGFQDATGCGGDGSYTIYPYGSTQVNDLLDGVAVVGFEVVQDFRMNSWGALCNYRYQQHFQFFGSGTFRVVGAAYGKGCSAGSIYRPLIRIDLAVAGDDDDSLAVWDGGQWQSQAVEGWWSQAAPYTLDGYKWLVSDVGGRAFYVEPGQEQFGDGGRGDNAFIYAVRHNAGEGDANLGVFSFPPLAECCEDDFRQGPHLFLNGELIAGENLVVWYVPQMITVVDSVPPVDYYCWTVSGEPNPETYPCAAGPLFHPVLIPHFENSQAASPGEATVFTNTTTGYGALSLAWDFGDGVGASTVPTPTYQYSSFGSYQVSLTVTDTLGTGIMTRTVWVGYPPMPEFESIVDDPAANRVSFSNLTTGSLPLSYVWDFGDGITSTEASPSHIYPGLGSYTVTLTATNPVTARALSRLLVVPWRSLLPAVSKQ